MSGHRLKFPASLTTRQFLDRHWQKKLLRIPDAVSDVLPALTADELGWLATLDDVESRLVFTERNGNQLGYRVENGPFASEELEVLPAEDWTLLVQDVDKHLPDFRRYFGLTNFIPDWRIDDLMVSFAAPGGSVGPHQDNYDVFLVQGAGSRCWHLAEPDSVPAATDFQALRLLEAFADPSPVSAEAGDILYLPPGVPHWGIAESACMTYSIGMRAPTRAEFLAHPDISEESSARANANVFYTDPDLSAQEAIPGSISAQAIERMRMTLGPDCDRTDESIATTLGSMVTEPKPWLKPAPLSQKSAINHLAAVNRTTKWVLHGMARLAYCEAAGQCRIFANGSELRLGSAELALVRDLCKDREIGANSLRNAIGDDARYALLLWLRQRGVFDL